MREKNFFGNLAIRRFAVVPESADTQTRKGYEGCNDRTHGGGSNGSVRGSLHDERRFLAAGR